MQIAVLTAESTWSWQPDDGSAIPLAKLDPAMIQQADLIFFRAVAKSAEPKAVRVDLNGDVGRLLALVMEFKGHHCYEPNHPGGTGEDDPTPVPAGSLSALKRDWRKASPKDQQQFTQWLADNRPKPEPPTLATVLDACADTRVKNVIRQAAQQNGWSGQDAAGWSSKPLLAMPEYEWHRFRNCGETTIQRIRDTLSQYR